MTRTTCSAILWLATNLVPQWLLGQVSKMGVEAPRRLPARTAVTAQVHGQDAAIGQGVPGQLWKLGVAGDAVHADDRGAAGPGQGGSHTSC
jgi:hypothetical protein